MCSHCLRDPDLEVLDVFFLLRQPLLLLLLGSRLVLAQFLPHRCKHGCYVVFLVFQGGGITDLYGCYSL